MGILFWGIMTAAFLIIEIIIPMLITIWMALAACILLFLSPLIKDPKIEILIFLIISLILLYVTRPFVKNFLNKKTNFNSQLVGDIIPIVGIVRIDDTKNTNEYEVRFKGGVWTAISDEVFEMGDEVKILEFKGNKIHVELANKK